MRPHREIKGYVAPDLSWDYKYVLHPREEGATGFWMVEGNVYDAPAFFNPVMVLNRDFSILFTRVLSRRQQRPIRFIEPLAGIGVRAFRLVQEVSDDIMSVVINDLGEVSSSLASYNIASKNTGKIHQYRREARSLLLELAEEGYKFQMLDLDPFGPPTPFLDSVWRVIQRNGLISVTATDMTALCGVFPDACRRKYFAEPLNNHHTHETAVRILIATVVRSAARSELAVTPIFSLSSHHYIKLFFKVEQGRGKSSKQVNSIGMGGTCQECQQVFLLKMSQEAACCGEIDYYGPIWHGDIFDKEWCELALAELDEMDLPSKKPMTKFLEEAKVAQGTVMYYAIERIASKLGVNTPPLNEIIKDLKNRGYRAFKTRYRVQALRSTAPAHEIENVVRTLANN